MAMTECPECGKEISTRAQTCPHCGAPQYEYNNDSWDEKPQNKPSTHKILGYIAFAASLVGIVWGGFLVEIAALIIGIIVFNAKGEEKSVHTFAGIAIIISLVVIVLRLVYLAIAGSMLVSLYGNIFEELFNMMEY